MFPFSLLACACNSLYGVQFGGVGGGVIMLMQHRRERFVPLNRSGARVRCVSVGVEVDASVGCNLTSDLLRRERAVAAAACES